MSRFIITINHFGFIGFNIDFKIKVCFKFWKIFYKISFFFRALIIQFDSKENHIYFNIFCRIVKFSAIYSRGHKTFWFGKKIFLKFKYSCVVFGPVGRNYFALHRDHKRLKSACSLFRAPRFLVLKDKIY